MRAARGWHALFSDMDSALEHGDGKTARDYVWIVLDWDGIWDIYDGLGNFRRVVVVTTAKGA